MEDPSCQLNQLNCVKRQKHRLKRSRTEMHRTNQLELKKKQMETANETMNRSKAENKLNCRTKKKLNMF